MNDMFYCYSKRLSYFIRAFDINYIFTGVNQNTKVTYQVYPKSEKLDKVIALYNEVKHKI